MRNTLGQITPHRMAQLQAAPGQPLAMTGRVKAAVIVRLLLAEGSPLPLSSLPEHMQAALTEQIGRMRLVDRTTLGAVVEEFLSELEQVGLSFPGGIEGALSMMDGHISTTAANRLRRLASASGKADPWDRIVVLEEDRLLPVLEEESEEVAAVMSYIRTDWGNQAPAITALTVKAQREATASRTGPYNGGQEL